MQQKYRLETVSMTISVRARGGGGGLGEALNQFYSRQITQTSDAARNHSETHNQKSSSGGQRRDFAW